MSTLHLFWDLRISGLNDVFFAAKSPNEILKLKPQRRYASELLDFSVALPLFFKRYFFSNHLNKFVSVCNIHLKTIKIVFYCLCYSQHSLI